MDQEQLDLIDSEDCRTLWGAVLATACEDAVKKRKPSSLRHLKQGRIAGYSHPTREAALAWMLDHGEENVAGSFAWVCLALNLEPGRILDRVIMEPEKVDTVGLAHCRINHNPMLRNGKNYPPVPVPST